MAQEKVLGFRIRVRGSEDTVKKLADVELQLSDVTTQVNSTKKAIKEATDQGDVKKVEQLTEEYKNLRISQIDLREESASLRKEIKQQQRDFEGIKQAEGSYRQLNAELVKLRREYKELSEAERNSFGKDTLARIQALDKELKDIDASIGQFQRNVGDYPKEVVAVFDAAIPGIGGFANAILGIGDAVSGVGAAADKTGKLLAGAFAATAILQVLIEIGQALGDIVGKFTETRGTIQQFTQASGDALDNLAVGISAISVTFGKETQELTEAVNAVAKGMEISFDDALGFVEDGFLRGADANGEFLDKLREYPSQFKAAGLGAQDLINVITQEVNQGIYSDKGVDTIKEFGLRIREQTKSTRSALQEAFGKKFTDDILGGISTGAITTAEALATISQKIDETSLPVEKLQTVIADVFGGAGEDASVEFIKSLQNIEEESFAAADASNELAIRQKALLQANKGLADANNELTKRLQESNTTWQTFGIAIQEFGIRFIIAIIDAFAPLVDGLKNIGSIISETIKTFSQLLPEGAKSIDIFRLLVINLELAGKSFKFLSGLLLEAVRTIQSFVRSNETIQAVMAQVRAVITRVRENISLFILRVQGAASVIAKTLQPVVNAIINRINTFVNIVGLLVSKFLEFVSDIPIISKAFDRIRQLGSILSKIFTSLPAVISGVVSAIVQLGTNMTNFFKDSILAAKLFAKQIELAFTFRDKAVKNLKAEIKAIRDQRKDIEDAGRSVGEAFRKGYSDAIEESNRIAAEKLAEGLKANEDKVSQDAINIGSRPESPSGDFQGVSDDDIKNVEDATKAIRDLKTELIDNQFDKEIQKLKDQSSDRIASLVGSPEQIKEQTRLLTEVLDKQIQTIKDKQNKAREDAVKALELIKSEVKNIELSSILDDAEDGGRVFDLSIRIKVAETEADFTEEKELLTQQLEEGIIDRELYNERLEELESELSSRLLEIKKQEVLQRQIIDQEIINAKNEALQLQLEEELNALDESLSLKREKILLDAENDLLSAEEKNNALALLDESFKEQKLQLELEFNEEMAFLAEETALNNIEAQRELAEQEIALAVEKNDRIRDEQQKTADQQKALTGLGLELLGTVVNGAQKLLAKDEKNRKKHAGILKAIALGEIAVNLAIEISEIAKAAAKNPTNAATFGIAGNVQAGIQIALAVVRAGIQAATVASSFESGGDLGSVSSSNGLEITEGGNVPSEGLITGRPHTKGGIKGTYNGVPVEFEGNEYRLRNGKEDYIINKKSSSVFRPLLDKLKNKRGYSKSKKVLASMINSYSGYGVPFQFGGSLAPSVNPLEAPSVDFASSVNNPLINAISKNNESMMATIDELRLSNDAVNSRIDRLTVIADVKDLTEKGLEEIDEVKSSEL